MTKSVGFFSTYNLWPINFETEIELIQKELNKSSKVFVYHCNKQLERCDMIVRFTDKKKKYQEISEKSCNSCIKKQNYGFNLISGNIIKSPLIDDEFEILKHDLDDHEIESSGSLKKLKIDFNLESLIY